MAQEFKPKQGACTENPKTESCITMNMKRETSMDSKTQQIKTSLGTHTLQLKEEAQQASSLETQIPQAKQNQKQLSLKFQSQQKKEGIEALAKYIKDADLPIQVIHEIQQFAKEKNVRVDSPFASRTSKFKLAGTLSGTNLAAGGKQFKFEVSKIKKRDELKQMAESTEVQRLSQDLKQKDNGNAQTNQSHTGIMMKSHLITQQELQVSQIGTVQSQTTASDIVTGYIESNSDTDINNMISHQTRQQRKDYCLVDQLEKERSRPQVQLLDDSKTNTLNEHSKSSKMLKNNNSYMILNSSTGNLDISITHELTSKDTDPTKSQHKGIILQTQHAQNQNIDFQDCKYMHTSHTGGTHPSTLITQGTSNQLVHTTKKGPQTREYYTKIRDQIQQQLSDARNEVDAKSSDEVLSTGQGTDQTKSKKQNQNDFSFNNAQNTDQHQYCQQHDAVQNNTNFYHTDNENSILKCPQYTKEDSGCITYHSCNPSAQKNLLTGSIGTRRKTFANDINCRIRSKSLPIMNKLTNCLATIKWPKSSLSDHALVQNVQETRQTSTTNQHPTLGLQLAGSNQSVLASHLQQKKVYFQGSSLIHKIYDCEYQTNPPLAKFKSSEKKSVYSNSASRPSDTVLERMSHVGLSTLAMKNINTDGDTLLSWTSSESPTAMILSPLTSIDSEDTKLMGYVIIQYGATTFGFEKYTGSFGKILIFPETIYSELF